MRKHYDLSALSKEDLFLALQEQEETMELLHKEKIISDDIISEFVREKMQEEVKEQTRLEYFNTYSFRTANYRIKYILEQLNKGMNVLLQIQNDEKKIIHDISNKVALGAGSYIHKYNKEKREHQHDLSSIELESNLTLYSPPSKLGEIGIGSMREYLKSGSKVETISNSPLIRSPSPSSTSRKTYARFIKKNRKQEENIDPPTQSVGIIRQNPTHPNCIIEDVGRARNVKEELDNIGNIGNLSENADDLEESTSKQIPKELGALDHQLQGTRTADFTSPRSLTEQIQQIIKLHKLKK